MRYVLIVIFQNTHNIIHVNYTLHLTQYVHATFKLHIFFYYFCQYSEYCILTKRVPTPYIFTTRIITRVTSHCIVNINHVLRIAYYILPTHYKIPISR